MTQDQDQTNAEAEELRVELNAAQARDRAAALPLDDLAAELTEYRANFDELIARAKGESNEELDVRDDANVAELVTRAKAGDVEAQAHGIELGLLKPADEETAAAIPQVGPVIDPGAPLPTGHVLNLSNDDLERLVTAAASDPDFDLLGRAKAAAAELRRRAQSVNAGDLGEGRGPADAAAAVERLPEIDEGVIAVAVAELPTAELERAAGSLRHLEDTEANAGTRALVDDALAELTLRAEGAQDARDALERLGEPLPVQPPPPSTTTPQPAGTSTSSLLELNGFHAVRSQVLGAVSTLEATPLEAIEAAIDYVKRQAKALEVSNEVGARESIDRADVELAAFEAARRFKRELEKAAQRIDARRAITAR